MGVNLSKQSNSSICAAFCFALCGKYFSTSNILLYSILKFIWVLLMIAQIVVGAIENDTKTALVIWSYAGGTVHLTFGFVTMLFIVITQYNAKGDEYSCAFCCGSTILVLLNITWIITGIVLLCTVPGPITDLLKITSIVSLCFSWIPFVLFGPKQE